MVTIVLQVLLGVVFIFSGVSNILGTKMMVDNFNRYRYPQWFRLVTGAVAVVGAVGMVIGIWIEEVAIGAGLWLSAMMIGAIYTDLFRGRQGASRAIPPAVLLAMAVTVCFSSSEEYV
ncbi:MAG: DoxX family protein [Dehalococcoidales bacterium]|nr:DoxX family protein [Dehalococcoidales bacterium]